MRGLEPRLFGYIWRYSKREQFAICAVVLASLPFYFASLELPKRIVNDAITGRAFQGGNATAPFLDLEIRWPAWLGGSESRLFAGFHLNRVELLLGLSGLFLALVLINGAFKYRINLAKGVLGERMLRRLRFQLFSLMLRFSPQAQREVKSSETATIIRDEVEPIGVFIGDAIVQPVFLGTQAATALAFILMQNFWLGLVAGLIVAVQFVVIPRLRREIIRLSRRRQIASRRFAGRVGEVLDGLPAVTAYGTGAWERAEIGGRLHGLFDLRLRIYQRKFLVKYLNNLLAQVTPFLFYAVGGLFALRGQLDIGQLVAVLAAYRDLPPPLKELIDWDQQRLDVEVKYETVAAHFAAHRLRPEQGEDSGGDTGAEAPPEPPPLGSPLRTESLRLPDPDGGAPLRWPDVEVALPARIALVAGRGRSGAEASGLAAVLAGLQLPQSGGVRIGENDVAALPACARACRIAYAGPEPILFPGSIRDNVLYGLRRRPVGGRRWRAGADEAERARRLEALRTGNPIETAEAGSGEGWIDYAALGLPDAAALDERALGLLDRLGMGDDLYRFGLDALSVVTHDTPAGARMIAARESLHARFAASRRGSLVIPFARGAYNPQATIARNLIFGVPRDPALHGRRLAAEAGFRASLAKLGLLDDLAGMGAAIARNLLDIFRDLPPSHPLYRRFSMVSPEDLPEFRRRLTGIGPDDRMSEDDVEAFLALALLYVEPRQRFGLLDAGLMRRIVAARPAIQAALDETGAGIEPFDPARINPYMSILDNLLFGRIDAARANSQPEIQREVRAAVRAVGLEAGIRRRGLEHQVGNRGGLLTPRQRGKLDLVRALLRRPEILVLDGTIAQLEGGTAMLFDALALACPEDGPAGGPHDAGSRAGMTLIAVTHGPDETRGFDVCLDPSGKAPERASEPRPLRAAV